MFSFGGYGFLQKYLFQSYAMHHGKFVTLYRHNFLNIIVFIHDLDYFKRNITIFYKTLPLFLQYFIVSVRATYLSKFSLMSYFKVI